MAGADHAGAGVAKQLLHGFGQIANGGSIGFLDEQIARIGVLKGKHDKVNGLIQVHQKAGHVGIGDGNGVAGLDLLHKQRNHVAVTGAADDRAAALCADTRVGSDNMLHHGLGDAHGIDGVSGFIGRKADHALHACFNGGMQHVVGALNVGAHGLHGEKLAGRNLLERSGMEDKVDAGHHIAQALDVAHIADVELDFIVIVRIVGLQLMAHVVLLFLVTAENADLADISRQKMLEHGVAKAAGAAGDQQGFIFENGICHGFLLSGDELLVVGAAASGIFQCP